MKDMDGMKDMDAMKDMNSMKDMDGMKNMDGIKDMDDMNLNNCQHLDGLKYGYLYCFEKMDGFDESR